MLIILDTICSPLLLIKILKECFLTKRALPRPKTAGKCIQSVNILMSLSSNALILKRFGSLI